MFIFFESLSPLKYFFVLIELSRLESSKTEMSCDWMIESWDRKARADWLVLGPGCFARRLS